MKVVKILGISIGLIMSGNGLKCQELKTALDSAAYVIGHQMGEYYFMNQLEFNVDAFHAGAKDGITGNRAKVQDPEKTEVMKAFEMYMQQKQQEKTEKDARFNKEVAKSIIEQNRQDKTIKETASGLQYQVIKEGTGAKPVATDRVLAHYVGTLYNGQTFDSSRDRGEPVVFPLNGVIKGWTEGLQLMKEGGIYKFWIPSDLGYGDQGFQGVIPGGSLLIFEVELIKVNPE
jgi:FKBP-type peptidyl-prolyl cis-trans isomerase